MGSQGERLRRFRFWILETLVLPLAMVPFRLLVWSWRKQGLSEATLQQIGQLPRVIIAVYHGELPASLAWANQSPQPGSLATLFIAALAW